MSQIFYVLNYDRLLTFFIRTRYFFFFSPFITSHVGCHEKYGPRILENKKEKEKKGSGVLVQITVIPEWHHTRALWITNDNGSVQLFFEKSQFNVVQLLSFKKRWLFSYTKTLSFFFFGEELLYELMLGLLSDVTSYSC